MNLETLPDELAMPSSVGEALTSPNFVEVDLSVERATLERGKKLPSSVTNSRSETPSTTLAEEELGNVVDEELEKALKESEHDSPPTTIEEEPHHNDNHFHEESSITSGGALAGETKGEDDSASLHEDLISCFCSITEADKTEARTILQDCNWVLEDAITRFYDK